VPRSESQRKKTGAIGDDARGRTGGNGPAREARRRTPIFIVASPRPHVGKTFLARLLVDFLRLDGGKAAAFDLNPSGDALADYLPDLTTTSDLGDVRGQMALFDSLVVDNGVGKVLDVGTASFERFFTIVQEIRFIEEATRRSMEPMILFAADPHRIAVRAYAALQERFPRAVLVPVFNEAIVKGRNLRDQYPFAREAAVPLQIPILAPVLKEQIEQSSCTFADLHERPPMRIPSEHAFELRAWTRRTFLQFRELELRLLLERLRVSLSEGTL
jgi:hypothetical protein